MSYFKAEVNQAIEQLRLNPKTNEYEGMYPDTYQDCGVVREIQAPTLSELITKIQHEYGDVTIDDDYQGSISVRHEVSLEYMYSMPKKEQTPAMEYFTFYISEVVETPVTKDQLVALGLTE